MKKGDGEERKAVGKEGEKGKEQEVMEEEGVCGVELRSRTRPVSYGTPFLSIIGGSQECPLLSDIKWIQNS